MTISHITTAPPHTDYPHPAGYLPDCSSQCHCAPGKAECVFGGAHEPDRVLCVAGLCEHGCEGL
ncbi:hypothetical protein Acy02nite_68770 [Actinoplanes cyaneus]|uniref:Uncharacterized protein n=1 Tax=Actinoplanes cyaneus TaxID=52696 RepID=A0A919IQA3_9ACTN|nr:hypothetical protein [Actinoplanes cyaneus]GID68996.1 hypothetical protein Acy02nite_68770 [Actinoplanes cyaneus]